jgi:hypothetical protein
MAMSATASFGFGRLEISNRSRADQRRADQQRVDQKRTDWQRTQWQNDMMQRGNRHERSQTYEMWMHNHQYDYDKRR